MKKVSLGAELVALRRAVEGAAEILDVEDFDDPVERRRRVIAVLQLTAERLRLLRRTIIGATDPDELLAPHNETEDARPGDDPDVLLAPCSPSPPTPRRRPSRRRRRG